MEDYKMKTRKSVLASCLLLALLPFCGLGTSGAPRPSFVYLVCTAGDKVYEFRQDTSGQISLMNPPAVETGVGPVGAAATPNGGFFYTNNETDRTISEFRIADNGQLLPIKSGIVAAPWADAFAVSRNGRYLYGIDSQTPRLTVYGIDPEGSLRRLPFHIPTDKLPLNMAFDNSGRFAYVLCGYGGDPQSGVCMVDEFRAHADGSLSPLNPSSIYNNGKWGAQIFGSSASPYIYVPSDVGVTEYKVSSNGQLIQQMYTAPSEAHAQVYGLFDEARRLIVATATPDASVNSFPDELVVTSVGAGGSLNITSAYEVDDSGKLSALTADVSDAPSLHPAPGKLTDVALASITLDPVKQILYAIDAQSFLVFRYSINANGTLTELLPSAKTNHPPQPPDPVNGSLPYAFENAQNSYVFFVAK
jgi:DNA-binding beta-propeller fold protein YncE